MVGDSGGGADARIAVIGLGLLGAALVERLLRRPASDGQGIPAVCGFDLGASSCEWAQANGVAVAESAEDAMLAADIIFFCLPTSDVVEAMIRPWLTRQLAMAGKLFVDTTTGRPQQMAQFECELAAAGAAYVEACVAGSSEQLRSGQAALLLGGADGALDQAEPILSVLADRRFRLGAAGSGAKFKLVHNLVLGLNRAALAEGLAFAESLGFDPGQAVDVLLETPAASMAMAAKGAKMAQADYTPQAKLSQHLKDVRLILAEAAEQGVDLPLTQSHQQLLELAEQLGWGDADNSAIVEAVRRRPAT